MSLRLEWSPQAEVAIIIFDRPEAKNAIDRATMDELSRALDAVEAAPGLLAVIVTASGDSFVSGGDLKDLAHIPEPAEGRAMSIAMQAQLNRLAALSVPTFAAINGDAYGGGCELLLACDVRIMKHGAHLEFRQTAMGLTTGWGGGLRLVEAVGRAEAVLLLTTGVPVEAEEAQRCGLVQRLTDDPRALAEALAGRLRGRSLRAIRASKRMLTLAATLPPGEASKAELDAFESTWGSPEHRAAVTRFLTRT